MTGLLLALLLALPYGAFLALLYGVGCPCPGCEAQRHQKDTRPQDPKARLPKRTVVKVVGRGHQGSGDARTFRPASLSYRGSGDIADVHPSHTVAKTQENTQ